jgi:hypothetical protein
MGFAAEQRIFGGQLFIGSKSPYLSYMFDFLLLRSNYILSLHGECGMKSILLTDYRASSLIL